MPQFASDYVQQREIDATARSTAEWDLVEAQIRERAFFMAGVEDARILQEFKDAVHEVAAGNLTTNEARKRLRAALREANYTPNEEDRGGIHDLSSRRRMEVTIETNVAMARGWQQHEQMKLDKSQPGLQLYRAKAAREPRDWEARWKAAADAVHGEGVAKNTLFVALLDSPIWTTLSRFGLPYPPFDFGSNMRVRAVPYEECEKLGLTPQAIDVPQDTPSVEEKPEIQKEVEAAPRGLIEPELTTERLETALDAVLTKQVQVARTSLNDGLEVDVRNMDTRVVNALMEQEGALVERVGNRLVSTDLNGTKEYTAERLAAIWQRGIPEWMRDEGFTNQQKAALEQWIYNHHQFNKEGTASTTLKLAMWNLLTRLKAKESTEVLYRGMALDDLAALNKLWDDCKKEYHPLAKKMADSFGTKHNAEKYAGGDKEKPAKFQVIFILRKHYSGKDLRPFYDSINTVQQDPVPMKNEGEVLFMRGTSFRVLDRHREEIPSAAGTIIRDTYEIEEIKPK